jgi:ribonuclease PH
VHERGVIKTVPLIGQVAAISCGLVDGTPVLDLDYIEDSGAQADANFVMTEAGGIVEIQGTAESTPFAEAEFMALFGLARAGIADLCRAQAAALDAAET